MDVIARGTFLECLEPYILNDKLNSIPPTVMKDFVEHYESKGMLENVEACIVHLEVTSLDIHHVSWFIYFLQLIFHYIIDIFFSFSNLEEGYNRYKHRK